MNETPETFSICAEHCEWAEKVGLLPHHVIESVGYPADPLTCTWRHAMRALMEAYSRLPAEVKIR